MLNKSKMFDAKIFSKAHDNINSSLKSSSSMTKKINLKDILDWPRIFASNFITDTTIVSGWSLILL